MGGTSYSTVLRILVVLGCAQAGFGCGGDGGSPSVDAAVDAPRDAPVDRAIDAASPDSPPVDAPSPDAPLPDGMPADGPGPDAPPHWGYEGDEGPGQWGDLPGYGQCKTGTQQSPVDIHKWTQFAPLAALTYGYAAAPATIVDNGHTVQVDFTGGTNKLTLEGKDYALAQLHFHAHSEHTMAGASYPLEMHLVHKAADGALAVLGVLFQVGAKNTALEGVFDQMGSATATPAALTASLDPTALLPTDRNGWSYAGSLTTPPCSEGVKWHVYSTVLEVSSAQLAVFTGRHPVSFRPTQGLNARSVASGNGTFTAAHWEYDDGEPDGPGHWGDLGAGEYRRCKSGFEQSPLDIPSQTVAAANLAGVVTAYAAAPATIVDNGHTVQVTFTGGTNKITLGGKDFSLLQFHFHAESEHTIDGDRYPLEMHLVHRAADGELAVLGVVFEGGDTASVPLAPVFDQMPTATATPTALTGSIDPSALLPADKSGWAYAGSLTTPPCTEGVRWHVYATPLPVADTQLEKFPHDGNYRPAQALGARTVSGGN